ncbi:MAG: amidohydrolase [Roseiflexus sp.]|nr:MAG: amidohydrolase [Roseiflexus sp.]
MTICKSFQHHSEAMIPDTILSGATIYPMVTAPMTRGAIAIGGDRILAAGPADDIEALAGASTRTVRLPSEYAVIPAFHDSHQHLLSYVRSRTRVALWDTTSIAALLERLRAEAMRRPPGEWIVAVGHDQGRLTERRHPTRAELDAAVPGHPLLIYRACNHVALANSVALTRAGITAATPDPPGGRIERDSDGSPTGVLLEAAMALAMHVVEAPSIDWRAGVRDAAREYHKRGIVAIGEAALGHIAGLHDLKIVNDLIRDGGTGLRMYALAYGAVAEAMLQAAEAGESQEAWRNDAWLRFGAIKYFADGTLGGGTAWLSEGYGDEPDNSGFPLVPAEALDARVLRAHRAGFQVAIHAIGDAAVAMALDAYERALTAYPRANHRHRIEHVEVVHAGLPERFARLEVIAAIQSCFTWWEEGDVTRLGPGLAPWGHAWGALQRAGVILANGSDNPVLPDFAPLQGIAAAVTRKAHNGRTIAAHQAIGLMDALRSYTWGSAYAAFADHEQGALAPGMYADIAVLDGDPLTVEPERIPEISVVMTIAGGKIMYEQ